MEKTLSQKMLEDMSPEEVEKFKVNGAPRGEPVHQENGKWYFWNETWSDRSGPFETEAKAREGLSGYCRWLMD